MKSNRGAIVLACLAGAVVGGWLSFWVTYETQRPTGMGGGMEGLGHAYLCLGMGAIGTIVGAIAGGLAAKWFTSNPVTPPQSRLPGEDKSP